MARIHEKFSSSFDLTSCSKMNIRSDAIRVRSMYGNLFYFTDGQKTHQFHFKSFVNTL